MTIKKRNAFKLISILLVLGIAFGGWVLYNHYQDNRGNIIKNKQLATKDLISFLRKDSTGCPKTTDGKTGYYKVVNEVNDSLAYLDYGCANDPQALAGSSTTFAIKNNNGWQFLKSGDGYSDGTYLNCNIVNQVAFLKGSLSKCLSAKYIPATPPPHERTDTWQYTIKSVQQ